MTATVVETWLVVVNAGFVSGLPYMAQQLAISNRGTRYRVRELARCGPKKR